MRNLHLHRALSAVSAVALLGASPAVVAQDGERPRGDTLQGEPEGWEPYADASIVYPPGGMEQSAWAPYRSINRPSADQMLDDPVLKGAIDIHAHYGPDTYPRQWDVFEIARRAQEYGLRGIVIKNHWGENAGLAQLTQKHAAPQLEVWGGLSLNATTGGINPEAVRFFAETEGERAKVVWMPTHDSQHEVVYQKQMRPYVRVSKDGKLLPQVLEVLDLIKQYDLTLATGHVYTWEMLAIMQEARARGIERIIITHPGLGPMFTDPTLEELQQAVELGGMVEVVASELFRDMRPDVVRMIREIGPEHIIMSSDSGLIGTPNHTDALVLAANILREEGFSESHLNAMFKTNPAQVLGLAAPEA
jgi:predicted TIM-barrel fold metal-dependent hydrolase